MDTLGLGFGEIFLILVLALIFIGPQKIVGFARGLGKIVYNIRKVTTDLTTQITKEIDEETRDLKETASQINKDLKEQKQFVSNAAKELSDGIKKQGQEVSQVASQINKDLKEQKQAVTDAAKELSEDVKKPAAEVSHVVSQAGKEIKEQPTAVPGTNSGDSVSTAKPEKADAGTTTPKTASAETGETPGNNHKKESAIPETSQATAKNTTPDKVPVAADPSSESPDND